MSIMGSIHSMLQGRSHREKVLVIACVVAVAGVAAMKWAIVPARAGYERNQAAIRQRVSTIERYEAIRKGQDRVDEELSRQAALLEKWENGLLAGETTSAAGVFLQGLLKPLTQNPQTRVTSIRALPPVRRGAYAEISVQLDVQTNTEELARLLAEISRQPKFLQVRKFTAHVGGYYGRQQAQKEVVAVSMVVAGLSAAPLDEKGAPAGAEP
jgi:hypothetical protein